MKIVGTKFHGHVSSLCLLDTKQKTLFSISTERLIRIKHNSIGITSILHAYDLNDVDCVSHSITDSYNKGQDNELRGKMTCNKDLDNTWPEEFAKSLAEGNICSFFHGRMDFSREHWIMD